METENQTLCREPKLEISIRPPPLGLRNPVEEGKENCQESEGMENITRMWSVKSTRQGPHGLTEAKAASKKPVWVCIEFFVHVIAVSLVVFLGLLREVDSVSPTPHGILSSFCVALSSLDMNTFNPIIVPCFVLFSCSLL